MEVRRAFFYSMIFSGLCWAAMTAMLPRSRLAMLPNCGREDKSCKIPVVLMALNNPTLLRAMVDQLTECFQASIIIIDNGSTLVQYLKSLSNISNIHVHRMTRNLGPHMLFGTEDGRLILDGLPQYFAFSDSDIRLNDFTPINFLCVLARLTDMLNVPKAGLALDLSDREDMFPQTGFLVSGQRSESIFQEQKKFFNTSIRLDWPELNNSVYKADIDTTFAVYNKKLLPKHGDRWTFTYSAVRVGGTFASKHKPWYPKTFQNISNTEIKAMFSGEGTMSAFIRRQHIDVKRLPETSYINDNMGVAYICGGRHHVLHIPH